MMIVFKAIFLAMFWAAVLVYVPALLYLLIVNPPLYRIERVEFEKIYIISNKSLLQRRKRTRLRTILAAYGVCVLTLLSVYFINRAHGVVGIQPYNIVSSLSSVVFGYALLTYLPVGIYLYLKKPLRYKEEGPCLSWLFIVYGALLVCFSNLYAAHWLTRHGIPVTVRDLAGAIAVIAVASLALAYVPVLSYVFWRKANPWRDRPVHRNVIFVIYMVAFLVFSAVYIINWASDRRHGVVERPVAIDFNL